MHRLRRWAVLGGNWCEFPVDVSWLRGRLIFGIGGGKHLPGLRGRGLFRGNWIGELPKLLVGELFGCKRERL